MKTISSLKFWLGTSHERGFNSRTLTKMAGQFMGADREGAQKFYNINHGGFGAKMLGSRPALLMHRGAFVPSFLDFTTNIYNIPKYIFF